MQPLNNSILDVTVLEPALKHSSVFDQFDQLQEGQAFTIHNDHDPKSLYYQLLGERGNIFTWDYLEKGPESWKVRIGKRSTTLADETLGQLAAKDIRKAQVFKKFALDFCCGGKRTVREACTAKGIDVAIVEQELLQTGDAVFSRALPYNKWSPDFLAIFIVNTHHQYVRSVLPDIRSTAAKVMKVHSGDHPELVDIHQLVESINEELILHMMKEEKILFPYIYELILARDGDASVYRSQFRTVTNPIHMMEMEHEIVGEALSKIRELSNNYTLPVDACASYRFLYQLLQEFEEDLHLHVHLENNILFPKAIELEKQILA